MAEKSDSKPKYEFGGPLGAAAIFGLPTLLYTFFFACNDRSGCPAPALLHLRSLSWETLKAQIPWPSNGIAGFASWQVTGWTLAYYFVSLVLYRVLPATELHGTKLRESGRPLKYRFNSFSSSVVQLFACAAGTYIYGADFILWRFIDENYLQLLTASLLIAFTISTFVYVTSFTVKPGNDELRELARGGHTGSLMYDFWIGRELNPRVTLPCFGEIDLKSWLEMRPGLTGWALLDLAFVAKQYRNYGYLSNSIVFTAAVQIYYVLEGQYAEPALLGMMDITADGLGFMLSFGNIVWVPFLYSTQCRYLAVYPTQLSVTEMCAVAMAFAIGLYIFRSANNQRALFRKSPNDARVASMSYIQTKRGTRLLTSGWWGMARHVNYFGDWLQASPFSLPTGIAGYVILPAGSVTGSVGSFAMLDGREVLQGPARGWGMVFTYFYALYFATLLIHRERRDDAACAEKYGDDWKEYKKQVPWRILPGVY